MAITHAGKLAESTTASGTVAVTVGQNVKRGSLVVVAIGGKAASSISVSSVTDSASHSYTLYQRASALAPICIAYVRTTSAIPSGGTITVTWSGTPSVSWVSAHAFEGAGGTRTDASTSTGVSTTAVSSVSVSGSDWLSFAVVGLPYDYGVAGETGANSSTLRDDNDRNSAAPWLQCASRNGTSGSTHSPGVVYGTSVDWYTVAVSWPYEALPLGGGGGQNSGLWAV
jgi:hypothetical protein